MRVAAVVEQVRERLERVALA
jgi:hypothetical protein